MMKYNFPIMLEDLGSYVRCKWINQLRTLKCHNKLTSGNIIPMKREGKFSHHENYVLVN